MSIRYPKEVHDFIRENVVGRPTKELVRMVNEKFGTDFTESKMAAYKKNHNLKSGLPKGIPKGTPSALFPQHIKDYILQNYRSTGPKAMAEQLNAEFGTSYTQKQLKSYYKNHRLNSDLTGRFEKGLVPHNKGQKGVCVPGCEKTWFPKGHNPANKTEVGTVRLRGDGFLYEKYGPGNLDWKPHHQLVWERAYGKQPKGHTIIFKDGNHLNCDLSNLALVSMAENLEMNRKGLRKNDVALTETGILIARITTTARKLNKKE